MPPASPPGTPLPRIWALLDDRPGHTTQTLGLARALNLPIEEKHLSFNILNRLPTPFLKASMRTLKKSSSSPLEAPYPDLVIGMGRRIAPVAKKIKKNSKGRTRVVLLGRKAASSPADIDMAIGCAHFDLYPHPRLRELIIPPTQVTAAAMAHHRSLENPIGDLAPPRVVWLLGGPTAQHSMDETFSRRMIGDIVAASAKAGGSLAIVTSRRTPATIINLVKAEAPRAHLHEWRAQAKTNPYLTYLAHADFLVVTGESESMLAEAVATGHPLTIYPLPAKAPGLKLKFARILRRTASAKGLFARLCASLLRAGWITPPRDLAILHRRITEGGMGALFDGAINRAPPLKNHEIDDLAREISDLLNRVTHDRT